MKLGILGAGSIVEDVLPFFKKLPLEKVVILGTTAHREKAEGLAVKYGLAGCCFDYDELLDSDIDTVYVALPNHLHYPFAKKALEKGKNVIVEKPAAANEAELSGLLSLSEERGVLFFEAMNIPYLPAFQEVREGIRRIGKIRIVSMNFCQYSRRYDDFKAGRILPAFDPAKAGGALMDINVYNLSFVMGLFGKPESVDYLANVERGIDTSGIVTLRYPGFAASCIAAKDCKAPACSMIAGDEGCIVIDHSVNKLRSFALMDNDGNETRYEDAGFTHRMYPEFVAFLRAIGEKDYEFARQAAERSLAVCRVMEECRHKAGIVFGEAHSV